MTPNEGERAMLEAVLALGWTLKLFTNNKTPAAGDTVADYIEASSDGYPSGGIALNAGSWTIVEGAPTVATYAQQEFEFTGPLGNVYGFYVVSDVGKVLQAERFSDGPYPIANDGDRVRVNPRCTLGSSGG